MTTSKEQEPSPSPLSWRKPIPSFPRFFQNAFVPTNQPNPFPYLIVLTKCRWCHQVYPRRPEDRCLRSGFGRYGYRSSDQGRHVPDRWAQRGRGQQAVLVCRQERFARRVGTYKSNLSPSHLPSSSLFSDSTYVREASLANPKILFSSTLTQSLRRWAAPSDTLNSNTPDPTTRSPTGPVPTLTKTPFAYWTSSEPSSRRSSSEPRPTRVRSQRNLFRRWHPTSSVPSSSLCRTRSSLSLSLPSPLPWSFSSLFRFTAVFSYD
jgi:hypothetical protein